jgi:hypothetical protein
LKTRAVASAWSSDSEGAASGVQQATGASMSFGGAVVVAMGVLTSSVVDATMP